jgi:hypothetical protein
MVNKIKLLSVGGSGNASGNAVTGLRMALSDVIVGDPERRDDNSPSRRDGSIFQAKPRFFGEGLLELNGQPQLRNPFKYELFCLPSRRDGGENGPRLAEISDELSGWNPSRTALGRRYRTRYQDCPFGLAGHPAGNTPGNGDNTHGRTIRPSITDQAHRFVVTNRARRHL